MLNQTAHEGSPHPIVFFPHLSYAEGLAREPACEHLKIPQKLASPSGAVLVTLTKWCMALASLLSLLALLAAAMPRNPFPT